MLRGSAVIAVTLLLTACGSGTATPGPTSPAATTPASTTPASAAVCAPSDEAGTITAAMDGNAFVPATLSAAVGDVVTWTNGDSVPHGIALDSDDTRCTESISGGQSGGMTFSEAGTYPFHCFIHANMKGTITIS
jgi:plastocyanin